MSLESNRWPINPMNGTELKPICNPAKFSQGSGNVKSVWLSAAKAKPYSDSNLNSTKEYNPETKKIWSSNVCNCLDAYYSDPPLFLPYDFSDQDFT